ncbi:iron ABC transporter ATP-binding protein [Synergistales bacterium]|nr:iron ABC transporter ATP-binding protein [Synergistales bacterium]
MALLTLRDVSFAYEGETVVGSVSFELSSRDFLCVLGENGSGKSTLVKGILRLLKPESGEILIGEGLRRDEIGYMPQGAQLQKDFPASVFEVVISGRLARRGRFCPFYTRSDKAVAREKLDSLGILDLSEKSFCDLSGGQRQRTLLARALCAAQKLLIMDEPTAGLDRRATEELCGVIRKLNKDGLAIIMVSHDIALAMKCATHILHIGSPGRCSQCGSERMFFGPVSEYGDARSI